MTAVCRGMFDPITRFCVSVICVNVAMSVFHGRELFRFGSAEEFWKLSPAPMSVTYFAINLLILFREAFLILFCTMPLVSQKYGWMNGVIFITL